MKLPHIILVSAAASMGFACSGGGSDADKSAADSTVEAEDTIVAEKPITPLPDTMMASAEVVKFSIERRDTAADGRVTPLTDPYIGAPGAFTFRANQLRNADFGGRLTADPDTFMVDWTFRTEEDYTPTRFGAWGGGTGWTGQPLYVAWPDSCLKRFAANHITSTDFSGREIMVGSLAQKVYFIDFVSGKASREAIYVANPIKGTMSLDPSLNGNLYVGHGVSANGPFGAEVIDLYTHTRSHFFGPDPKAPRRWDAYDSSPIRAGRFLFRPGENGTLYKFEVLPGKLELHSALRYTVNGAAPGMEASMSIYRNYGFTADNGGNILCINLDTLTPVWRYKLPDDADASPVLIEEAPGRPYLYVGCEVEHEGVDKAAFAKIDALTGEEAWKTTVEARRADVGEKHFDGGFYATPLPGQADCSHLIFANCVKNTSDQNGCFMAFDRSTGKVVYSIDLRYYAWSSPVGFISAAGHFFVVTADCAGRMYLIRGADGTMLHQAPIGANFESSPVVVGNSLVVGSRGNSIYKISLK